MTRDEALKVVTDPETGFTDGDDKPELAECGADALLEMAGKGFTKEEALNLLGAIVSAVRACYGD